MSDLFTTLLRGRKVLLGKDFYQKRQLKKKRLTLGNRYADWTFCPELIDRHSVVYSFGVGRDISFDLTLIRQFHLEVHAFDPSPDSVDWIGTQELPEAFHFHSYGLAATDGQISFAEPADPGIRSLYASSTEDTAGKGLKKHVLPVRRLSTILQTLGHQRIDILKMDIEGAEYEVVEDIVNAQVPIAQVLVEFHHRFSHVGIDRTRQAIARMNRAGYLIFHVSATGEEFSFMKTEG